MVNVGIIGCSKRIDHLLKKMDYRVNIAAVCDLESNIMHDFRIRYNSDAKEYADYRQLITDPGIDWVMVGSWNAAHAEQAIAAMEAGKHIFLEKPVATKFSDCLKLRQIAQKNNVKVLVGFSLRFAPHYRKIKQLLNSGAIGDVISFEFNETLDFNHGGHIMCCWRRKREFTGSHILEKCCHDIDQAGWMIGARAARVASFGGLDFFKKENETHMTRLKKSNEGLVPYCAWPTAIGKNPFTIEKNIIDNQVAIIEYENGVRATFHTNLNAGIPERRMYINGTEGCIRGEFCSGKLELCRIGFDEEIQDMSETHSLEDHGGADPQVVNHLVKMMYDNAPTLSSLDAGIEAATTCFALDESMQTGQVIDMNTYWSQFDTLV